MALIPDLRAYQTNGFSPDGLSYSVIDDLDKMSAQAMAEYEARIKSPRYNPFGPSPDSPERLDAELFAPLRLRSSLMMPLQDRYGYGRAHQPVAPEHPRIMQTRDGIYSIDPKTFAVTELKKNSPRPATGKAATDPLLEHEKKMLETTITSGTKTLSSGKYLPEPIKTALSNQVFTAEAKLKDLLTHSTLAAPGTNAFTAGVDAGKAAIANPGAGSFHIGPQIISNHPTLAEAGMEVPGAIPQFTMPSFAPGTGGMNQIPLSVPPMTLPAAINPAAGTNSPTGSRRLRYNPASGEFE